MKKTQLEVIKERGKLIRVYSGRSDKRNHVCKVEIMRRRHVPNSLRGRLLYVCRRIDNGSPVLAWEEDFNR